MRRCRPLHCLAPAAHSRAAPVPPPATSAPYPPHQTVRPSVRPSHARLAVWSINLGEIRFSEEQCSRLADALRLSGVTHMFYECTVAGDWKETFRAIIRNNRAKHGFWRLGPDAEQNRVVLAAVKSW